MKKIIKASIIGLTKTKSLLLDNDYFNYQWWMIFGVDNGLLSCFKAHKGFKQKEIKYKEYPLPLWSVLLKDWFRKKDTKITKDWIKIPNSKRKGVGLWLPLKFHKELPKRYNLKDSILVRKNGKYYIYFCIEIQEPKKYKPRNVIGIDLGLKNPVTLIDLKTRKTLFLGEKIKEVKGKYFYLKRKIGKDKNIRFLRKIRNKESNKINSILHKVSKSITELAYKNKSAIVIGKLKNIKKDEGRKFNRKLSGFSYYKLYEYLKYKSLEKGIPIYFVNEHNTSKTCNVCGSMGKRTKNWFVCENCRYKDNADRNAAFNIAKRGLSYMLKSGVEASALKSLVRNTNEETSIIKMQNCISV